MKYVLPIAIVTAIAIGIILKVNTGQPARSRPSATPVTESTLSTKTNEEGPVAVTITPVKMKDSEPLVFNIALDTHSGSLDQDLTQLVFLTDDNGSIYKPINWNGAPPGGHHREGELAFPSISPKPDNITLTVKDIGNIPTRTFMWELGPGKNP